MQDIEMMLFTLINEIRGLKMQDIEWLEPTTVAEATEMSMKYDEEGKIIAGGTWLSLVLKEGLLMPSALISLHNISGLDSVSYEAGIGLRIGAMVSLRAAELNATIEEHFPELAYTFGVVANVRVRNQATVGGCLCDADYASDPPAMLTALNAQVVLQSPEGTREVVLRDFIVGHYETTIRPDEVLTEVIVPERSASTKGVYLKYRTRSNEDRPCVGVAAVIDAEDSGTIRDLNIVVGAVANTPQYVSTVLESAKRKQLTPELIEQIAEGYAESIEPLSDIRGSAWYRSQMIKVFVKRALNQLGGGA